MSGELARALAEANLFNLLVPEQYGGRECHPWDFFTALTAASAADGSAGWCLMIGNTTGLLSASLPQEWATEIYGANPKVITVGVTAPIGKAQPEESGMRVSGRWPFGSGSQIADWICGGCHVIEDGAPRANKYGQPEHLLVFFPADEVTIHTGTWDTSGLRGTGSHDIEVADAPVPEGRWVVLGKRPLVDAPLYQFPTFGLLALGVSAVSIGIAQRALAEFETLAGAKTPTGASRTLANRPSVQSEVALAYAELESALAFTEAAIGGAYDEAISGARMSLDTKARLRLAATHNAWSATRIVDRLYHCAGGSAIYAKNKLQQCFRDVHVPTQHIMVGKPTPRSHR